MDRETDHLVTVSAFMQGNSAARIIRPNIRPDDTRTFGRITNERPQWLPVNARMLHSRYQRFDGDECCVFQRFAQRFACRKADVQVGDTDTPFE